MKKIVKLFTRQTSVKTPRNSNSGSNFSGGYNNNSDNDSTGTDGVSKLESYYIKGINKCIEYIESFLDTEVRFYEVGANALDPVTSIESLLVSGTISREYLRTLNSVHSVTTAIKNCLKNRDPIIPAHQYAHYLSPLSDHYSLLNTLPIHSKELLRVLCNHFSNLINQSSCDTTIESLAAEVGIYILRPGNNPQDFTSSNVHENDLRMQIFAKIVDIISNKPGSGRQMSTKSMKAEQSSSPLPQYNSIQDRSVKITFLNPSENRPNDEQLRTCLSKYGNIVNIGFKEKLAVVLFTEHTMAMNCASACDGGALGPDFKIKYLGSQPINSNPNSTKTNLNDVKESNRSTSPMTLSNNKTTLGRSQSSKVLKKDGSSTPFSKIESPTTAGVKSNQYPNPSTEQSKTFVESTQSEQIKISPSVPSLKGIPLDKNVLSKNDSKRASSPRLPSYHNSLSRKNESQSNSPLKPQDQLSPGGNRSLSPKRSSVDSTFQPPRPPGPPPIKQQQANVESLEVINSTKAQHNTAQNNKKAPQARGLQTKSLQRYDSYSEGSDVAAEEIANIAGLELQKQRNLPYPVSMNKQFNNSVDDFETEESMKERMNSDSLSHGEMDDMSESKENDSFEQNRVTAVVNTQQGPMVNVKWKSAQPLNDLPATPPVKERTVTQSIKPFLQIDTGSKMKPNDSRMIVNEIENAVPESNTSYASLSSPSTTASIKKRPIRRINVGTSPTSEGGTVFDQSMSPLSPDNRLRYPIQLNEKNHEEAGYLKEAVVVMIPQSNDWTDEISQMDGNGHQDPIVDEYHHDHNKDISVEGVYDIVQVNEKDYLISKEFKQVQISNPSKGPFQGQEAKKNNQIETKRKPIDSEMTTEQNFILNYPRLDTTDNGVTKPQLMEEISQLKEKVKTLSTANKMQERIIHSLKNERQSCEDEWESELLSLHSRCNELELENQSLKDSLRKLKMQHSSHEMNLQAAHASKTTLQIQMDGFQKSAERQALSTVFSHQRLVKTMEDHLKYSNIQIDSLTQQLHDIEQAYAQATKELVVWKSIVMSMNEGKKFNFSPTHQLNQVVNSDSTMDDLVQDTTKKTVHLNRDPLSFQNYGKKPMDVLPSSTCNAKSDFKVELDEMKPLPTLTSNKAENSFEEPNEFVHDNTNVVLNQDLLNDEVLNRMTLRGQQRAAELEIQNYIQHLPLPLKPPVRDLGLHDFTYNAKVEYDHLNHLPIASQSASSIPNWNKEVASYDESSVSPNNPKEIFANQSKLSELVNNDSKLTMHHFNGSQESKIQSSQHTRELNPQEETPGNMSYSQRLLAAHQSKYKRPYSSSPSIERRTESISHAKPTAADPVTVNRTAWYSDRERLSIDSSSFPVLSTLPKTNYSSNPNYLMNQNHRFGSTQIRYDPSRLINRTSPLDSTQSHWYDYQFR